MLGFTAFSPSGAGVERRQALAENWQFQFPALRIGKVCVAGIPDLPDRSLEVSKSIFGSFHLQMGSGSNSDLRHVALGADL